MGGLMEVLLSTHLTIPMEIIQFSYDNNLKKPLQLFLYLKSVSSGIINQRQILSSDIKDKTGIRDKRSINKYLSILKDINWIGYNKTTGNYFIRSFSWIRKEYGFGKRSGVIFELEYLSKFRGFVEAAILCSHLKRQEFARKAKIRQKAGAAALKKVSAIQAGSPMEGVSDYVGMSNFRLSRLLGCSMPHANKAKILAEKHGYIITKKKYEKLYELTTPDYRLRSYLPECHKIRFKKRIKKGKASYLVLRQKHDEISSRLSFKRIGKL